jgi:hypothetical protein
LALAGRRPKVNSTLNVSTELGDLHFRTGAAMLARLGSEQLKDEITAVIELVKNAYDADATTVRVELRNGEEGQSLRIQDNGSGMTGDDLHSKWAFLATENKLRDDRSPGLRRKRLGQKGVGRFAAEKLGRELILRTKVEGQAKLLQVRFNWDDLRGDHELAEYRFPIKYKNPEPLDPPHGTRLDIRRLRLNWTRKRVEKLRAQLASLIDPDAATDFKILFSTSWQDLNDALKNPLPGNETHRIEFEIDGGGHETTTIFSNGAPTREVKDLEPPSFGPIRGRLRYFGKGLTKNEASRGGDASLDWNMGVRLFRDGCRVRPYGEPGPEGDWLQIYRNRYLKGSRFRLKPHYLEGTIHISKDENPQLRDTTSREGLDANEHYAAFVDYVQDKVAALSELLREEELREERLQTQERYKKALQPVTAGLNQLGSEEYRKAVESADKEVRKGLKGEPLPLDIRNAHWECVDCGDSWKAPKDLVPTRCREFSVGRDGRPTNKPGCGSQNIRRKENVSRENPRHSNPPPPLDDVLGGAPAYVSGIQLTPVMDWEMGERDEEAEVRPDRRQLAINGRHQAFRAADLLDGNETVEGTALEELRAVAALTVHVVNAAAHAWGRWHYIRSGGQFDVFLSRAAELKAACLARIPTAGGVTAEVAS